MAIGLFECLFGRTLNKDIQKSLNKLIQSIEILNQRIDQMSLDLSVLVDEVAALQTVEASAVALIQKLADEVAANAGNPEAVAEIAAKIKAASDALSAAVAANTSAAPVEPVAPVEPTV